MSEGAVAETDFEAIADLKNEDGSYRFPWLWEACYSEDCDVGVLPPGDPEDSPQLCNATGHVLIEGRAERWVGLAEVALTIPKAIVITPYEWDEALPKEWITVGHFDVDALAKAIRKAL